MKSPIFGIKQDTNLFIHSVKNQYHLIYVNLRTSLSTSCLSWPTFLLPQAILKYLWKYEHCVSYAFMRQISNTRFLCQSRYSICIIAITVLVLHVHPANWSISTFNETSIIDVQEYVNNATCLGNRINIWLPPQVLQQKTSPSQPWEVVNTWRQNF